MPRKPGVFPLGLAIFTMLFGAGNVVFPLTLGRDVGDKVGYAIVGFFIAAVAVPLLGLIAAMMFGGNYKSFLSSMGRIPGMIVGIICMVLIGPFGATPRCVTLAHAAISWYVPCCSLFLFSILTAILIFFLTMRKGTVVEIFGRLLGPIKLTLLLSIIVIGFTAPMSIEQISVTPWMSFLKGLREGYFTLDLLSTIFFAGLIYGAIVNRYKDEPDVDTKKVAKIGLRAGLIGGGLLGLVYIGFCVIAAMYGPFVAAVPSDQILNALACLILGQKAGVLVNITVAVACLTTAMALSTVFADYLSNDIFKGKLRYTHALFITVLIVCGMANLGFSGIMGAIEPVVVVCYPALIVLAFANILHKLFGFRWVKHSVYATFVGTLLGYYGQWALRLFI